MEALGLRRRAQRRGTTQSLGDWYRDHQEEIKAFAAWGVVYRTGEKARLYLPSQPEAWREIVAVAHEKEDDPSFDAEALVVSLYQPGAVGFDAIREELQTAPLLASRQREVQEVLDSCVDERYFVTVCGALPLVEHVLSSAAGKWNDLTAHLRDLMKRLHQPGSGDDLDIFTEATAVDMVRSEIPELWKPGRHTVRAINDKLNRHLALHGTARGWDDVANALRAILLLAAAARVAPLLSSGTRVTEGRQSRGPRHERTTPSVCSPFGSVRGGAASRMICSGVRGREDNVAPAPRRPMGMLSRVDGQRRGARQDRCELLTGSAAGGSDFTKSLVVVGRRIGGTA